MRNADSMPALLKPEMSFPGRGRITWHPQAGVTSLSPCTRERNIICNAPVCEEGTAKQHMNSKTGLNVSIFPSFYIKTIH